MSVIGRSVFATVAGFALSLQSVSAFSIYTSGHGDLGVEYHSGDGFEPHWHLGSGATVDGTGLASEAEYEPDALVARTSASRFSPAGSAAVLGVADGTLIYAAGSSTYQPNLGFSAEELNLSDWDDNITLSLTGWSLPSGAAFALYSTNLAGTAVTDSIFSTYDAGATLLGNSLPLTPGDHVHYQWAFTHLGDYELTFEWTGTHLVDGFQSATESFSFSVVPEPSTYALIMLLFTAAFVLSRRRLGCRS